MLTTIDRAAINSRMMFSLFIGSTAASQACRARRRHSARLLKTMRPLNVSGAHRHPARSWRRRPLSPRPAPAYESHLCPLLQRTFPPLTIHGIGWWHTSLPRPGRSGHRYIRTLYGHLQAHRSQGGSAARPLIRTDGEYDPATLWWRHEKRHRSTLLNFPARLAAIYQKRDALEAAWLASPPDTATAFHRASVLEAAWQEQVDAMPLAGKLRLGYQRYWWRQNQGVGLANGSHHLIHTDESG